MRKTLAASVEHGEVCRKAELEDLQSVVTWLGRGGYRARGKARFLGIPRNRGPGSHPCDLCL